MPLPARSVGRRRRPKWPLAAGVGGLGRQPAGRRAGALMAVLANARLLRRSMTLPPRTVLLASTGPMPEKLLPAGPDTVQLLSPRG